MKKRRRSAAGNKNPWSEIRAARAARSKRKSSGHSVKEEVKNLLRPKAPASHEEREFFRRVNALVGTEARARDSDPKAAPATEQLLKHIWPAWNSLDGFLPEERVWILTGHSHPRFQTALRTLQKQGHDVPLDRYQYLASLEGAQQWEELKAFANSTQQKYSALMVEQWAFAQVDSYSIGRLAIFRAAKELETTLPGLLNKREPSLDEIQLLKKRTEAYFNARLHAHERLMQMLFPDELLSKFGIDPHQKWRVVSLFEIDPHGRRQVAKSTSHYHCMEVEPRQAPGVPSPPAHIPEYFFIGRLDAVGLCSQQRLQRFFGNELSNLSREERRTFYRVSLRRRFGKAAKYIPLAVWIVDNEPVFDKFGWTKEDVHTAALDREIPTPKNPAQIHKLISDWNLQITLRKLLCESAHARAIHTSTGLLSPGPMFKNTAA